MENETLTIKITRRDKIYISIIAILVVAILVLAICLPRPYKTVEVEKPVVVEQKVNVYPTEKVYIISQNSAVYDDVNENYILAGKEYVTVSSFEYVDLNSIVNAQVSVMTDDKKNTYGLKEELKLQVIQKPANKFETKIEFSSVFMNSVKLYIETQQEELAIMQEFLFEFTFENAKVNFVVSYISE